MPSTPVLSVAAATLMPTVLVGSLLCVLGAGGASSSPAGCGPAGTAETVLGVQLDAEQMANAQTILTLTAGRGLSSYAGVVAVDAAYTEDRLRNSTVQTDHDSQGLFQQRVSIYGAAVADDPVKATNAFLDRLLAVPNWQRRPVGVDAQAVQDSAYPQRYQPNASLAAALVGLLWPVAAANATEARTSTRASATASPGTSPAPGTASASTTGTAQVTVAPVICVGGDGAVPLTGGEGDSVAGITTIPAGLVLDGTARGDAVARYALAQRGKPYVFGAAGPASFDCSGLTASAWATQGIALAHYAATQAGQGTPEPPDLSQAVSGDLVLIPGADGTAAAPGHVGIVAGYTTTTTTAAGGRPARELWLVQAPGYQNLPVELTDASEWSGQIVAVRHIA